MILYAIYKNGMHKGNERALNGNEAIVKYVIASDFSIFLKDKEFMGQYSFKKAIERVHYHKK